MGSTSQSKPGQQCICTFVGSTSLRKPAEQCIGTAIGSTGQRKHVGQCIRTAIGSTSQEKPGEQFIGTANGFTSQRKLVGQCIYTVIGSTSKDAWRGRTHPAPVARGEGHATAADAVAKIQQDLQNSSVNMLHQLSAALAGVQATQPNAALAGHAKQFS